jgi:formylglycine-generating enzyme required for sulfatase activity
MKAHIWHGVALIIVVIQCSLLLLLVSCVRLPELATTQPLTPASPLTAAATQEIATLRGLAADGDETALAEALDHSMVAIPAGEFIMGSEAGRDDERPARLVYLDAYELDRFEVANAQYRRFLLATGGRPPRCWTDAAYPPARPTTRWSA